MKTYCLIVLVMFITVTQGIAATSIVKISQWPYSSTLPVLQPSPNSVATGSHSGYADGIVIWAVGDTLSVINAVTLIEITSFQVITQNSIRDLYYNESSETLYLALGTNGLQIYDLSTLPLPPTRVGDGYAVSDDNPGYLNNEKIIAIDATGIGYHEKMVDGALEKQIFLTDNNFGLRVIDVTDTTAPLSEVLFEEPIYEELENEFECRDDPPPGEPACVNKILERTSGYIQPNVNRKYDTTGGYVNIEVIPYPLPLPIGEKIYAIVHDYYWGLRVFDVTDPTAEIERPASKFLATDGWFLYNALINDIYVAVGSDYDTDNPKDRLYAYITAYTNIGTTVAMRLDVLSDDNALVPESIDGEEGSSITNRGRRITGGTASGIFVKGDHIFVADGTNGIEIVDISTGTTINDDTPVLNYPDPIAGSYDTGDMNVLSLVGDAGNKIYLHDAVAGLHEIDITVNSPDDVATLHVNTKSSPIAGESVYVDDGFAYCLDSDNGLRIFDNSEPSSLTLESFYQTTGNDITVLNNYAYIATGDDGLEIVDVTTKTDPVPPMPTPPVPEPPPVLMATAGSAVAVAVYQNGIGSTYACVAASGAGLAIIDVSTPSEPDVLTYVAGATANDVSVYGDFAYIAEDGGLKIVSLSDYSNSWTKAIAGNATAVCVYDNGTAIYALVAVDGTIVIENVTDRDNITTEGTIDPEVVLDDDGDPIESGEADVVSFVGVDVLENYLFAAAASDGIYVYDITAPSEPRVFIGKYESLSHSKEVFSFKKDDIFYFASAEASNGIAVYNLKFSSSSSEPEPLGDTSDDWFCFITSLEY